MKKNLAKLVVGSAVTITGFLMTIMTTSYAGRYQENPPADSSPTLFALVVSDSNWPLTEPARGMYAISSDMEMTQISANNNMTGDAAMYADGKYYIGRASMVGTFMVTGNSLTVYDAETGEQLEQRAMPTNFNSVVRNFAYDRANDKAYAITFGGNANITLLNTFDRTNFTYTPITQLQNQYQAIATDPDGELYGVSNSTLYRINTENGSAERLLAWSETALANTPQSLAYSPEYEAMLWTFTNSETETKLVSFVIEADNLRSSEIGQLGNTGILSLHSTAPLASPMAPATVSDLAFFFFEPGDYSGQATFTVPDKTISGDDIKSPLTLNWLVDGETAGTKTVEPGKETTFDVTFTTEGYHKIAIELFNGSYKGERSSIDVFAGFDTPATVNNLKYTISGNDVELSWDAAQGVHGGALQPLSYRVTHNGSAVVTVKDTSCIISVTGAQTLHSFGVTAISGDKVSDETTLSGVVAGNPFNSPYNTNFETEDDFALFSVINANNDNSTWKYMAYYRYAQYNRTYGDSEGDDYLISPRIAFEQDNVYSLQFTTVNNGPNPEALSVILTNGTTLSDMEEGTVIFSRNDLTNRQDETFEVLFTPAATGPGNIAFHYFTDAENSQNINLNSIRVERLGKTTAPKAVSSFDVIPADEVSAYLNFILPTETFDGRPLSQIDKVEIYRDGDIIHTIASPSPGATLTYTDEEKIPAGNHTYGVGVFNDSGCGQIIYQSAYIGALTLPIQLSDMADGFSFNGGDDNCWRYDSESNALIYDPETNGYHADIAYTPFFYAKKDEIVNAIFDYEPLKDEQGKESNIFFVGLCSYTSTNPQIIYPAIVVRTGEGQQTESRRIIIPEDGIYAYCFSIDGYINDNQTGVKITSLEINADLNPDSPGSVTDLNIIPADNGELEGDFSFTMPEITLGNNPLDGTVGARIYSPKHELLAEVTDRNAADKVNVRVPLTQGLQTYYVTTYNESGIGASSSYKVFSGIDTPLRVTDLISYPSADNMSTEISWGLPDKGEHNGWFDASQLRYNIYVDGEYVATTDRRDYYYTTDEPTQRDYLFSVTPVTDAGEGSQRTETRNFLGTLAQLPFNEDFAGGEYHNAPYRTEAFPMAECIWHPVQDFKGEPALLLDPYLMTEALIYLPKLSLNGKYKPQLTFDIFKYYKPLEDGSYYEVEITDDDNNFASFGMFMSGASNDTWETLTFDLSDYVESPWIGIRIKGAVHENGDVCSIRNLSVTDLSSGVEMNQPDSLVEISGGRGFINISGLHGNADIYDINGRHIAGISNGRVNVPAGIYLVTLSDGRTFKITVK